MAANLSSWGKLKDRALEAEFREIYRKPGARYLGIACTFGGLAAIAFYLIDAIGTGLPWLGGAQSARLLLAAAYFSFAVLCVLKTGLATRHYALLFGIASTLFVA